MCVVFLWSLWPFALWAAFLFVCSLHPKAVQSAGMQSPDNSGRFLFLILCCWIHISEIFAQTAESRKVMWWLPARKDKGCVHGPHDALKWSCKRRECRAYEIHTAPCVPQAVLNQQKQHVLSKNQQRAASAWAWLSRDKGKALCRGAGRFFLHLILMQRQ